MVYFSLVRPNTLLRLAACSSAQRPLTELQAGFARRAAERHAACPILSTARRRRAAVRTRCASRLGRRATIRRLVSSCEELGAAANKISHNPFTILERLHAEIPPSLTYRSLQPL